MGILGTISAKNTSSSLITPVTVDFETARTTGTGQASSSIFTQEGAAPQIGRGFFLFDSTTIPAGATINSVIFVHPLVSNFTNNSGAYAIITAHTATDPIANGTNFVTNYGSVTVNGATSFGSIALSVLGTVGGTVGVTLNAQGIANFSAGGTSKYAIRLTNDFSDVTTGTNLDQYNITFTNAQLIIDYNPTAVLTTHSKFWGGA